MTVYFIKPVGMDGPIKIGCSWSPDRRLKTLETWSPFALEIVAQVEGDMSLERRFHAMFEANHERREWFTATPALLRAIQEIQAGTFDLRQLPAPKNLVTNREAKCAAQRASWTPERRIVASYSARVRATQLRTRTVCPVFVGSSIGDDQRKIIDAYLADPHQHGEPLSSYVKRRGVVPWWARKLDLCPEPARDAA